MLSIIIINFNCSDLLLNCVSSIYKETNAIDFEIIIVDNSQDLTGKLQLCNTFPSVKWLDMSYNAGFARANNYGIEQSKGDVVLLLNPDTIIINNAIANSYNQLKTSQYVACGVQLLNEDGSPQIAGNFAMKGGLNYLLPLPYIGNMLKWVGETMKVKKPNIPKVLSTVTEVDWINGAFLMVKKSVIERAGLLDNDFFLYAEEAEWCSRLKKQGPLCIFGNENIYHLQGEAANAAFQSEGKGYYNLYDKKGLQIMLSNFLRISKQFGLFWFFLDLVIYTFDIPVFFVLGLLDNIFHLKNPFTHLKKWIGLTKNIFALWSFVPKIVRNKPYFYKVL